MKTTNRQGVEWCSAEPFWVDQKMGSNPDFTRGALATTSFLVFLAYLFGRFICHIHLLHSRARKRQIAGSDIAARLIRIRDEGNWVGENSAPGASKKPSAKDFPAITLVSWPVSAQTKMPSPVPRHFCRHCNRSGCRSVSVLSLLSSVLRDQSAPRRRLRNGGIDIAALSGETVVAAGFLSCDGVAYHLFRHFCLALI